MKVWHASPSSNRGSIARKGLLTKPKKKLYTEAHGLYLWKNKTRAAWFARIECKSNDTPYDLYEVDAFESALRPDEMLQMPDAVYSIVDIPPERIRMVDTIECNQRVDEATDVQEFQQQATKAVNHIASTIHRGKKAELLGPAVIGAGKMVFHGDEVLTPGEAEWRRVKEGWKGLLFGIGSSRYFVAEKNPDRAWLLVPYGTRPDAFRPSRTDQRASLKSVYDAHNDHPDFMADFEQPLPILYVPRESVPFLRGARPGGEWLKPSTALKDVIVIDGRKIVLGHEQAGAAIRDKKAVRAVDIGALKGLHEAKGMKPHPKTTGSTSFQAWFKGSKVVDAKGRPLVVYHGTPRPGFTRFSNAGRNTTNQLRHLGFWFTADPGSAAMFTKELEHGPFGSWEKKGASGGIYPVFLSIKNPKIYQPMEPAEKQAVLEKMEAQVKELKSQSPFFYHDMPHDKRALYDEIQAKIDALQTRMRFIRNDDPIEQLMDDRDEFAKWISGEEGVRGAWRKRYIETGNIEETTKKLKQKLMAQGHDGIILRSSSYDMPRKGTKTDQFVAFEPSQIKSATAASRFDPESDKITDSYILAACMNLTRIADE